jgi:hypothetical protein
MMKKNNDSYYSDLTSFEDFRLERTRLILKSRLIETRINLNFEGIRETFSLSGLVFSMLKELFFSKIGDILGILTKKSDNEDES